MQKKLDRSSINEAGWFDTGDIAFVDENGQFVIRERVSSVFKYFMHQVCNHKKAIPSLTCLYKMPRLYFRLTQVKLSQFCMSIRLFNWPA